MLIAVAACKVLDRSNTGIMGLITVRNDVCPRVILYRWRPCVGLIPLPRTPTKYLTGCIGSEVNSEGTGQRAKSVKPEEKRMRLYNYMEQSS
jgi:hypothetical protein